MMEPNALKEPISVGAGYSTVGASFAVESNADWTTINVQAVIVVNRAPIAMGLKIAQIQHEFI